MKKKLLSRIIAFILCLAMVLPVLAACKDDNGPSTSGVGVYTYRSILGTPTTDWNPHTSTAADSSQLQGYMYTPFYGMTVDQDSDEYNMSVGHKDIYEAANGEPVDITQQLITAGGGFTTTGKYMSGTTDTALKAGDTGRAWKIPLRSGMKWDNGDPITASQYVWSIEKLINPEWGNARYDSITSGTAEIMGAALYNKGTLTDFDEVGYYAVTEGTQEYLVLVYVAPKTVAEVRNLSTGSSYLVHEATYMATAEKQAVTVGGEEKQLYRNTYNKPSNWQNTRSSGPYKMNNFSDQEVSFTKNDSWFGYSDQSYISQYGLEEIYQINALHFTFFSTSAPDVVDLMMRQGTIDTYGVNLDYKQNYTSSLDQWRYSPSSTVMWLDIITDLAKLTGQEAVGRNGSSNVTLMAIPEFRLAISTAIDRHEALSTTSAASKPTFTLLPVLNMVDWSWSTSLFYRDTLEAKEVIAKLYDLKYVGDAAGSVAGEGVYDSLDEAVALASGFDFDRAVELFNIAYEKATDPTAEGYNAAFYNAAKDIYLNIYSVATQETLDGNSTTARLNRSIVGDIQAALRASDFAKDATGSNITVALRGNAEPMTLYDWFDNGDIEALFGGVQGATTSIPNRMQLFLNPALQEAGWYNPYRLDAETIDVTIGSETKSLLDWFYEMTRLVSISAEEKTQEDIDRLIAVGAACELAILQHGSSIPIYHGYGATVYSYRFDMSTVKEDYNVFMGFGGFAEMKFLYDDASWAAYVQSQGGTLTY